MKKQSIIETIALFLVLVFIYTATSKVLDYDRFVFQMTIAPLPLMKNLAATLGWGVPSIEVIIVIFICAGFFIPWSMRIGLVASLCLMTSFEIYIILMIFSGYSLPCTCGGIISQMSWKAHVFFNAVIIALISLALKAFADERHLMLKYKDFSRV